MGAGRQRDGHKTDRTKHCLNTFRTRSCYLTNTNSCTLKGEWALGGDHTDNQKNISFQTFRKMFRTRSCYPTKINSCTIKGKGRWAPTTRTKTNRTKHRPKIFRTRSCYPTKINSCTLSGKGCWAPTTRTQNRALQTLHAHT